MKPAIDAAIVAARTVAGQEARRAAVRHARHQRRRPTTCSTSRASKSYQYIDKTKNFFWHRPRYAAVELCLARAGRDRHAVNGRTARCATR